eukprot:11397946-Ditylum_brightwellii.AAC.1
MASFPAFISGSNKTTATTILHRLYLGVTMLSGITLADGETLDPHMRSGNRSLLSSSAKQLL